MIGLLIVTHCDLGKEFLSAAEFIVGRIEAVDAVSITQTSDSKKLRNLIEKKIADLNSGQGVLILTDMFGGTPSNLSLSFLQEEQVEVPGSVEDSGEELAQISADVAPVCGRLRRRE